MHLGTVYRLFRFFATLYVVHAGCPSPPSFIRKALFDAVLLGYLFVTLEGAYITCTHKPAPFLSFIAEFAYVMMAPYQGNALGNQALAVDAFYRNGTSYRVPVDRYFPGALGEANARQLLLHFTERPMDRRLEYTFLLSQMLQHERVRDPLIDHLSAYIETWERSVDGYETLRADATREFITSVR